jgi:putative hydrolase of the HAD superfamily
MRSLLLDLDDTVVVDDEATVLSLMIACSSVRDTDAGRLMRAVWREAHIRWTDERIAVQAYAAGIGPLEPLLIEPTQGSAMAALGIDPIGVWAAAMAEVGLRDVSRALAFELQTSLRKEHRRRSVLCPGARAALEALRVNYRLILISNGSSELQREKLVRLGLIDLFECVLISAEVGCAKPDRAIFLQALARSGVVADEAVMVGDSFEQDVRGALAAGLRVYWLDSGEAPLPERCTRIPNLAALTLALATA